MKIKNASQLHDFINVIGKCSHSVWLESVNGDYYDLKDELDLYRGIGALIGDKAESLELFAFISKNAA